MTADQSKKTLPLISLMTLIYIDTSGWSDLIKETILALQLVNGYWYLVFDPKSSLKIRERTPPDYFSTERSV